MARTVILFEDHTAQQFRPLSWSLPVYELPCGLFTLRERVQQLVADEKGLGLLPDETPVLPEIDALTDANGQFEFPIVLRGSVVITADTGAPDPQIRADEAASMRTDRFADADGERVGADPPLGLEDLEDPAVETMELDRIVLVWLAAQFYIILLIFSNTFCSYVTQ